MDFSPASMAIAEQRINIRNLGNVKFLLGNIESLSDLKLGDTFFERKTTISSHIKENLTLLKVQEFFITFLTPTRVYKFLQIL